jgi:peroxiredoxin Q/BCP
MTQLNPGDPAPDFTLKDQHGNAVSLADFRGRKVLIYFYPEADTPGCTAQARSLRDAHRDLEDAGVAVLGVSPDLPDAQLRFDEKYHLGFPLLSDPDHRVAERYGAWGEKSMLGSTSRGILRSSFLVDRSGRIAQAWYRVRPEDTVPKALNALKAA